MQLRLLIKRILRHRGYDLHRFLPTSSPSAQMRAVLNSQDINLVLDVGANEGLYGRELREQGFGGRVVSFEPLTVAYERLLACSRADDKWQVAERVALGDTNGEIEIYVSANSVSSSVLPMLDAHLKGAPDSAYVGIERVPVRRLDSISSLYLDEESRVLLKIDTQGFEDRVLDGASGMIDRVVAVQVELSLTPLYADQKLFLEMVGKMNALGFDLWAVWPVFVDPTTGRSLQLDATFVRSS